MNGIKVLTRENGYIDFTIASDSNVYRYTEENEKITKLFGLRNSFGKAIRGNARKQINELAKYVYENNLPFAFVCEN